MMLRSENIAKLLRESADPQKEDPFVIVPTPDLAKVEKAGAVSVDLRLGTWFVSLIQAKLSHIGPGDHGVESQLTKRRYIPFGKQFYLHPRSFVLSATLEWIRLPRNLGAYVVGRSSWGRRGLIIATAVGVHPGFKGCLTLELSNVGELPIELTPGMAVCQLCIHSADADTSKDIDQSQYLGSRLPSLGKIEPDELEIRLAKSHNLA